MWQRFTERARRVVFFAQEEAQRLGTQVVRTEHLLLGLLRDGDSVALRILDRLDISREDVRSRVEETAAQGTDAGAVDGDFEISPGARRALDVAYDEAQLLNNNYIGTEHLLLGFIRDTEEGAGPALAQLGADVERARREIRALQGQAPPDRYSGAREHQRRAGGDPGVLRAGDLGVLRAAAGRTDCELALDADAFRALAAVFAARDHHGYRELRDTRRVVTAPAGVPIKILVFDADEPAARNGGCRVRVLGGDWEGRAGWVAQNNVEITGPDERPFPPVAEDTEV